MVVGHDQAGRIHHHARTQGTLHLLRLLAGYAEEPAEDRIIEQRIAILHDLGRVDVDHRRLHALHDRRVGQSDVRGRGRDAAILLVRAVDGAAHSHSSTQWYRKLTLYAYEHHIST